MASSIWTFSWFFVSVESCVCSSVIGTIVLCGGCHLPLDDIEGVFVVAIFVLFCFVRVVRLFVR